MSKDISRIGNNSNFLVNHLNEEAASIQGLSREAFEAIVGSIPAGIVVIEKKNGKVVYVNERAIELYGVDPRGLEMPEHSTKLMKLLTLKGDVYPPEKLPASKALLTGQSAQDELVIERADGSRVIVAGSAKPIRDQSGKITAAVAIFEDITERKKAEEELYKSRDLLSSIINSSDSVIIARDLDEKLILLNDAELKIYKRPKEKALGTTPYDIYPEEVAEHIVASDKKVIADGKSLRFEETIPIEGVPHTFMTNKFPLRDLEGRIYGTGAVITDITQRKQAEESLRESEERLSMAQSIAHLGSWEYYVKQDKVVWSEELFRVFGLKPQPYGPSISSYVQFIHPEDREKVNKVMEQLLFEGKASEKVSFDYRILLSGGSVRTIHSERVVRELGLDGKPVRILGIEQDITGRKRIEEQLEEYSTNLEKLVEKRTSQLKDAERLAAIGATAGMVGHDLRNPLQSIIGEVYLAKMELTLLPDAEHKMHLQESIQAIAEQISYMDKIVSDLQTFVKPVEPAMQVVKLKPLLSTVLAQANIPKNIQTTMQMEDKLTIMADPQLLKRVLLNLVTNAVQAMPEGGELAIKAQANGKDQVQITVKDTGVGIPEEIKPKIFTPLFTTKSKGQGFGLAVCKRVIEAQGGTITFESKVGTGTKFTVSLPAQQSENH